MAKPTFATLKAELDKACAALRRFTLGYPGCSQRQGASGIHLVRDLCDRMGHLFRAGTYASQATIAMISARGKAGAAQARLNLLRSKQPAVGPAPKN